MSLSHDTSSSSAAKQHKKRTPKQIAALLCVFFLIAMYLVTFLIACLDLGDSGRLFANCLLATIALPILLWIYIWLYGIYQNRHNMASLDILHSDEYTGTNLARETKDTASSSDSEAADYASRSSDGSQAQ